jgi:hypothetical protein
MTAQRRKKANHPAQKRNTKRLEHFKILCTGLGRHEDKAGKENFAAILKYCE